MSVIWARITVTQTLSVPTTLDHSSVPAMRATVVMEHHVKVSFSGLTTLKIFFIGLVAETVD